jgi:hypothetical protein
MSCGGTMWWTTIYLCVMDDCRTSNGYLSILFSLCLSCDDVWYFGWPCVVSRFTLRSWPSCSFLLLSEYNMSYYISFSWIYLFTHTCGTPRITKFRGSFCLDVCKSCKKIIIEIQVHAYIKGSSSQILGFKSFKFFHSYKSLSWLSLITKKGEIKSAFAPYVGFGVLMTSKLGTNVILMRHVAAIGPMKDLKSWSKMKWYLSIHHVENDVELKAELQSLSFLAFGFRYAAL